MDPDARAAFTLRGDLRHAPQRVHAAGLVPTVIERPRSRRRHPPDHQRQGGKVIPEPATPTPTIGAYQTKVMGRRLWGLWRECPLW